MAFSGKPGRSQNNFTRLSTAPIACNQTNLTVASEIPHLFIPTCEFFDSLLDFTMRQLKARFEKWPGHISIGKDFIFASNRDFSEFNVVCKESGAILGTETGKSLLISQCVSKSQ